MLIVLPASCRLLPEGARTHRRNAARNDEQDAHFTCQNKTKWALTNRLQEVNLLHRWITNEIEGEENA
jgi:hypothetical protein